MDILQKLLNKEQSKSSLISSGSVAQKGTTYHALNATKDYDTSWIVDSGASDRMTGNPTLFQSYQPCFEKHKIKIADGSFSRVVESKGTPGHNNESDLKLVHSANQSNDTLVEHVTEKNLDADDGPIALGKGKRTCTQHSICKFVSMEKLSPKFKAFTTQLDRTSIPKDIHEALKHLRWKAAVHEEIKALEKNGTWDITELPPEKSAVGCKWLFTVKYLADGSIDRFKARLAARDFIQTYGVDYKETFAPVAKLNTVKFLQ
ncbi:hypothetical protein AgCh_002728 [Apium graveolens]